MSQHATHGSDRFAAYRGLILGAITLAVLIYSVSRFTSKHDDAVTAAKASTSAP